MEEADEAIHDKHEEAEGGAGAHDDEGDEPLRQALVSKPSLHDNPSSGSDDHSLASLP